MVNERMKRKTFFCFDIKKRKKKRNYKTFKKKPRHDIYRKSCAAKKIMKKKMREKRKTFDNCKVFCMWWYHLFSPKLFIYNNNSKSLSMVNIIDQLS